LCASRSAGLFYSGGVMKIWIFNYIDELTENYHGSGGLVVIAKNESARDKLINANKDEFNHCWRDEEAPYPIISKEEMEKVICFECDATEEAIFVFPDAGCC
jgi:hypothetical protein